MMSLIVYFVLSFFPRDVLDEIWDLIGSVSEGFPTSFGNMANGNLQPFTSLNQSKHHCYTLSTTCTLIMLASEVRPRTNR